MFMYDVSAHVVLIYIYYFLTQMYTKDEPAHPEMKVSQIDEHTYYLLLYCNIITHLKHRLI